MYDIYKMEIAHYLFPLKEAGLPCSSVVKNPCANAGETEDAGSIPGSGRYPGERNGSPCQYSCLKNPMDRGAWQATVHGVAKSQTQLSDWSCVVLKKIIEKLKLEDGGGTEKEKEKQAGRENWREAEFKEKVTQPNLHVLWNFQAQEQCSQNTETLDCKVSLRNVREVKLLNPTCNGSTRQPGDHKAQQYSRGRTAWASCPMIRGGEGAFTCVCTVSFSELGCKAKVATWFPTPDCAGPRGRIVLPVELGSRPRLSGDAGRPWAKGRMPPLDESQLSVIPWQWWRAACPLSLCQEHFSGWACQEMVGSAFHQSLPHHDSGGCRRDLKKDSATGKQPKFDMFNYTLIPTLLLWRPFQIPSGVIKCSLRLIRSWSGKKSVTPLLFFVPATSKGWGIHSCHFLGASYHKRKGFYLRWKNKSQKIDQFMFLGSSKCQWLDADNNIWTKNVADSLSPSPFLIFYWLRTAS